MTTQRIRTQRLREAVACQGSHWLARALLLTRMDLMREGFNARLASVAALLRAELHRRGVPTR